MSLPPNASEASDAKNPPLVQIDEVHPSQEIENASQSNDPDNLPKTGTKRKVQQVSTTKQARKTVLQILENWVVEHDTDKGLMGAAIKQFLITSGRLQTQTLKKRLTGGKNVIPSTEAGVDSIIKLIH
ncbi:hypothetical protein GEMRC1_013946 [Eukaryota sp. GEM-RC1]